MIAANDNWDKVSSKPSRFAQECQITNGRWLNSGHYVGKYRIASISYMLTQNVTSTIVNGVVGYKLFSIAAASLLSPVGIVAAIALAAITTCAMVNGWHAIKSFKRWGMPTGHLGTLKAATKYADGQLVMSPLVGIAHGLWYSAPASLIKLPFAMFAK
ncbi:MAG: hypothetical protein JO126_07060 [Alphaproteobacteria bacterium]|nr:hypothetical protein [Alphaproteobacteria bacterium]MBV8549199.1 hypothetical protein [Alphaproteobacteria bacterium]